MRNLAAVMGKFVWVLFLLFTTTGLLFNWTPIHVIEVSLFITGTSYIFSDLVIFPSMGSLPAAAADFTLALLGSWAVATIVTGGGHIPLFQAPLYAAIAIAICDGLFFHHFTAKIRGQVHKESIA